VTPSFSHPYWLLLLPIAALPWLRAPTSACGYPAVALLPTDALSAAIAAGLRLLATLSLGACVLALAGPFTLPPAVPHVGRGAQIVLLLDRSRSMDEPFAGDLPTAAVLSGRSYGNHESKGAAARRLLAEFAKHREHDLISLLLFTTIPIRVIDFTARPDVVQAAIGASNEGRGLAETDVGAALLAAVSQFDGHDYNGSRVIVLVSDGGAELDAATQTRIAAALRRDHVVLYWLYLRTHRSPGLLAESDLPPEQQAQVPEHFLHVFFSHMGTPYRAYEAEDPAELGRAIDDVDRLERFPIRYVEPVAPHDFSGLAYGVALSCVVLLLGAHLAERSGP